MISIVLVYRERELLRIKNALDSLKHQLFKEFEVVFIDYGSNLYHSKEVSNLIKEYSFVSYYFADTRGWYWNRSHALNMGIEKTKFENLFISDIDIVYNHKFLEYIAKLNLQYNFYTFGCYKLEKNKYHLNYLDESFNVSNLQEYHGNGLMYVNKMNLKNISGFDEYYMVWGGEDDDIVERLKKKSIQHFHYLLNDFPIFHQWHVSLAPNKPDIWYLTMLIWLYKNEEQKRIFKLPNINLERKVFSKIENSDFDIKIEINYDRGLFLYNSILKAINNNAYKSLYIKAEKKWTGKIFSNYFSKSLKKEEILFKNTEDVFKFIVGVNRFKIEDYFIRIEKDSIELFICKC